MNYANSRLAWWRAVPALALLFVLGCSDGGEFTTNRSCEAVTCGDNASCSLENGVPLCSCDPGYQGGRNACEDIDECATGAHDCDTLCVNSAGGYECLVPESCAAVLAASPGASDGEYTLYVDGDVTMPWSVYCHDMGGLRDECRNCTEPPESCPCGPVDYLSLVQTGVASNFSQYEATEDGRTGKDIHTAYQRVRIDPQTFAIDVTDATFAESLGEVIYDTREIDAMSYGVAMSCDRYDAGQANIDLTGTPFTLSSGFCTDGFGGGNDITTSADNRVVDMSITGGCAWVVADDACAAHPFDGAPSALALQYGVYEKQVFVSSEVVGSDIGGLAGADAKCQELATNAGLSGTYAAWLGSPQGHPAERFVQYQVRYILPDGTLVAENWRDLTDGTLRHAIDQTESGGVPTGDTIHCSGLDGSENTAVWTATNTDGVDFGVDWSCGDWSGSGERVGVGSYERTERGWSDACRVQTVAGSDVCQGQFAHLYCFEE